MKKKPYVLILGDSLKNFFGTPKLLVFLFRFTQTSDMTNALMIIKGSLNNAFSHHVTKFSSRKTSSNDTVKCMIIEFQGMAIQSCCEVWFSFLF